MANAAPPGHRALFRAAVPAILDADPCARVRRATWLGQGWGATAFRVPSPSGDWTARFPKPTSAGALEDLAGEVRLLPLIEQRPFEVTVPREPRLLRDAEGRPLGTLHRLVPGTALAFRGAPRGAARARLCEQIGRFLSVLHDTSASAANRHGARSIDLWRSQYVPLVAKARPHLPDAARAWVDGLTAEFERGGASSDAPRVLIHGDVSGHHLLLAEDGALSGVIDFADAFIADPALDFAGVLNHLGWRDLERVWEHYTATAVDEDTVRRTRFYIAIAPIYDVGEDDASEEERRAGIRRLVARARAARS